MSNDEENIYFFLNEDNSNTNDEEIDLSKIENEIYGYIKNIEQDNLSVNLIINYQLNYTVKDLLKICEYYGFAKELKLNKCNKDETIQCLVNFELDKNNKEIVNKRHKLWFYINEIKNDKFMKKFILW